MTRAERQMCDYLFDRERGLTPGEGRLGSFFSHLFSAIAAADVNNLEHLWRAFDEQVNAWKRYQRDTTYWPRLSAEYREQTGEAPDA